MRERRSQVTLELGDALVVGVVVAQDAGLAVHEREQAAILGGAVVGHCGQAIINVLAARADEEACPLCFVALGIGVHAVDVHLD